MNRSANRRWARSFAALAGVLLAALLAGCATPLPTTSGGVAIDTSRSARGQDSRVLFLILHYTVADLPISLKVLTEHDVSAHYVVSDETPPRIFRLVDEGRRAWHSGASAWKGHRMLNASSVGIEIVHPGFKPGPNGERIYQPFSEAQMQALIPLIQDIVQRHQIRPDRILGHGEVSPAYKEDPGPTFPWRRLAEEGITPPWPDASRVAAQRERFEALLPDAAWFQRALAQHGYLVALTGEMDEQTQRVLMNFQMRYRPEKFDGTPDAETAALLHVLTQPLAPP
ncbi:MAG: N-acetylmuramoyl-L-alanine amidase [Rubrivivax sp.]|nr:N-acetylmuramoyl-L-alanine amidase [Rubrivivax sp.]